jgi:hypothetical protein
VSKSASRGSCKGETSWHAGIVRVNHMLTQNSQKNYRNIITQRWMGEILLHVNIKKHEKPAKTMEPSRASYASAAAPQY